MLFLKLSLLPPTLLRGRPGNKAYYYALHIAALAPPIIVLCHRRAIHENRGRPYSWAAEKGVPPPTPHFFG